MEQREEIRQLYELALQHSILCILFCFKAATFQRRNESQLWKEKRVRAPKLLEKDKSCLGPSTLSPDPQKPIFIKIYITCISRLSNKGRQHTASNWWHPYALSSLYPQCSGGAFDPHQIHFEKLPWKAENGNISF